MNTMRFFKRTAFLALFTISSVLVNAADTPPAAPPTGGGGRGTGGGGTGGGRGGFVNLDDKQRELLRDAMQKDSEQIRALDEKMRAAQKELVQATLAEKYDEKVVREKADAVGKIQTDLTVLRAKAFSTVAPTLKPEQREQLENSPFGAAMLMGRFGMGGGGPGMGGRGPGGGDPAAGGTGTGPQRRRGGNTGGTQ